MEHVLSTLIGKSLAGKGGEGGGGGGGGGKEGPKYILVCYLRIIPLYCLNCTGCYEIL